MKNKPSKTIQQANKERYNYYTHTSGTYNYGVEVNGEYFIYRKSDNKLLHHFSITNFSPIP